MESSGDLPPPPPYSEVDPQSTTSDTSNMGGGDYSPTSTLRPTSSQSMRAPSFMTLRGGYLRGVPFSDDPVTSSFFQDRAFEFEPNRELVVIHREITADTLRTDLTFPDLDSERDVSEQDWQTFVNYVLTELGNETASVRHRKKLSAEEFYRKQTNLEQVVSSWNEAFFQPRSIKFIAHYYYSSPRSPAPTYRSRVADASSGLRRIPIEDGNISPPQAERHRGPRSHYNSRSHFRGGHSSMHSPGSRCNTSYPPFLFGGLAGNMERPGGRGWPFGHQHERRHGRGRSRDFGHSRREYRDRNHRSQSSNSSGSDTEDGHRRGPGRPGRGSRRDHGHEHHRHRSDSISSDSSLSSVSSISSDEADEPTMGAVREAIANFRLDPTNYKHNKIAYRQLLQQIRQQKQQALQQPDSSSREVRRTTKAQRKAIYEDLKSLRNEAKSISKRTRNERRNARKEAYKARKEAKKAAKEAGKAARKVKKTQSDAQQQQASTSQVTGTVDVPNYDMPGSFPRSTNFVAEQEAQHMRDQVKLLESHVRSLREAAYMHAGQISNPEKQQIARSAYNQEIQEVEGEITLLQEQIGRLGIREPEGQRSTRGEPENHTEARRSNPNTSSGGWIGQQGDNFGRSVENWGERFGRDMENWGENFGREMERWGEDFGRRMSQKGKEIGQRFG